MLNIESTYESHQYLGDDLYVVNARYLIVASIMASDIADGTVD